MDAMLKSAVLLINSMAPKQRVLIFVMYKFQLDVAKDFLEQKIKGNFPPRCDVIIEPSAPADRPIVLYSRDSRPDLNVLAEDALVLSTSVLQTGANLPPVKLVLSLGHAYSLEALLQAAGS
jgi:hypothetical protein